MLSLLTAHFYGHYPCFPNIWLSVVFQIVAVLGSSFSDLKACLSHAYNPPSVSYLWGDSGEEAVSVLPFACP